MVAPFASPAIAATSDNHTITYLSCPTSGMASQRPKNRIIQMRQYKVNGQIFCGFNKDFTTPHKLVLCQDEDSISVWAIDDIDIVEEIDQLTRFFVACDSQEKIIGTYQEMGFLGFKLTDNTFVSNLTRF